jgi:hypothetical protein
MILNDSMGVKIMGDAKVSAQVLKYRFNPRSKRLMLIQRHHISNDKYPTTNWRGDKDSGVRTNALRPSAGLEIL